ncbi:MAG: DUF3095 family protein [Chitinophagales bacterium]
MTNNHFFYKNLTKHSMSLVNLLGNEHLFSQVPEDWHMVVLDIEKSTQAVKNGFHKDVNLTATGGIIVVLNKLKTIDKNLKIPYFFGGDGATFVLPNSFLEEILAVLENYRHHVKKNMHLNLKIGSFPVKEVYRQNRTIRIAKFDLNAQLTVPIVLGTGLKYAEGIIKSLFVDETENHKQLTPVNLEGMECRWQEIDPPYPEERIVCLLVNCPNDVLQGKVYQHIIAKINAIFGTYEERQPISTIKLKLDLTLQKIKEEMYARIGKYNFAYLIKNWLITIFGKYYFIYFEEGRAYLQKVSELSYTLMIDGTLNNVISGTQQEIDELVVFLDKLEAKGKIRYGIHTTHASIMSCYVEDRKEAHIHFVDGTEGGYTAAAEMFKGKALINQ